MGLKGNSLSPDIMATYSEPNGTKKLLDYMLDNLHGKKSHYLIFVHLTKRKPE